MNAIETIEPSPKVSSRYKFLDTKAVTQELGEKGWQATYTRSMTQYGLHEVRFENKAMNDLFPNNLGLIPQIKFVNSHDGRSSAKAFVGVLRQVCSNGLVATRWDGSQHRHTGDVVEWSRFMIDHFMSQSEKVADTIKLAASREATVKFKQRLIEKVFELREWQEPRLLFITPQRREDTEGSVWTEFNVAQEFAMNAVRKISGVQRSLKINLALWKELENEVYS